MHTQAIKYKYQLLELGIILGMCVTVTKATGHWKRLDQVSLLVPIIPRDLVTAHTIAQAQVLVACSCPMIARDHVTVSTAVMSHIPT